MNYTVTIDPVSSVLRYGILDLMSSDSLAQRVRDRIAIAYGGNQAAFARAMGISPQSVNNLVQGKTALPLTDARRRLARELGISHVMLLVLAGELTEKEAGPQAPPPFDPDDPRSAVVDALRAVRDEDVPYVLMLAERFAGL